MSMERVADPCAELPCAAGVTPLVTSSDCVGLGAIARAADDPDSTTLGVKKRLIVIDMRHTIGLHKQRGEDLQGKIELLLHAVSLFPFGFVRTIIRVVNWVQRLFVCVICVVMIVVKKERPAVLRWPFALLVVVAGRSIGA
jgi:hypothetical protein